MNLRAGLRAWWDRLRADRQSFNRRNTDEMSVIHANYFSIYHGVPVLRTKSPRSGSFGIIFLRHAIDACRPEDAADELRHEYGHILQLRQLGLIRFALCIGIASWRQWGEGEYYQRPWEITADLLGGVITRQPPKHAVEAGLRYLEQSRRHGIRTLNAARKGRKI